MKKMIKRTSALAISAFMAAQYIPFSAVAYSTTTCDLTIHPYRISETAYNNLNDTNNHPSGTTDPDATQASGITGATAITGMTFNITKVDSEGNAITGDGAFTDTATAGTKYAGLADGYYLIDPQDTYNASTNTSGRTDGNFDGADAFIIQVPVASAGGNIRDVHIYPKLTDNGENNTPADPDDINPTTDFHAIKLTKYLSDTNDSMSTLTATFAAYYEDAAGKWVSAGTYTTNSSGEVLIDGLPLGTYYLVETAAPAGYMIDRTPIQFTVNGVDSSGTIKTMTNEKILDVKKDIAKDAAGNTYNWVIKGDIPDEPSKLSKYEITDNFSASALTGVTVSSVKVGDTLLALTADYTVDETDKDSGKIIIKFTTEGLTKLDKTATVKTVDVTVASTIKSGYSSASVSNSASIAYTYGATTTGPINDPDTPDPVNYPTGVTPISDEKEVTLATLTISNTGSGELKDAEYSIKNEAGTEVLTATDNASNDPTNTAKVANLAPGHYLVYQTAPGTNDDGDVYLLVDTPINIYVSDNGTIYSNPEMTSEFTTHNTIVFENTKKSGFSLPFTGTTATIIFTVTGLILMAGTLFFIIILKKRDDDDEEQENN